jgi:hypothetical protein
MILAYQQEHGEAAQLPHHLRILALAQTLAEANYGGMAHDIATHSRASRVLTRTTPGDKSGDDFAIHTQGFIAMKAKLQGNCNGNTRGPRGPLCAAPNAALSYHRCSAAPWRAYYQGTCDACGQWGHPQNSCNKVGAWAFLHRYHRDRTNMAMIKEAERAWVERTSHISRTRTRP